MSSFAHDSYSPTVATPVTNRLHFEGNSPLSSSKHLLAADGQIFEYSQLRLLVLQSTPLCNINCSYCYLPDRKNSKQMHLDTVDQTYEDLMTAPFVGQRFTTVWHAGEPLTVNSDFYAYAIKSSQRLASRGCKVSHSIQTNATLVTDEWCEFFKNSSVRIGVSLDGPAELHDRNRKNRAGKGTHSRVMRGIAKLKKHGVDFHAICVLTRDSLQNPDSLIRFFASEGIRRIGFNVEEVEGINNSSSLAASDSTDALRRCLSRFHELAAKEGILIREFDSVRRYIRSCRYGQVNAQSLPFGIVSLDVDGNFSTFSPELLTMRHLRYGHFTFGNVHTAQLSSMLDSPKFRSINADIQCGIQRCRAKCEYFGLCGGGAPSNKLFENGTFDSTETMYCRLTKKTVIDVALPNIEKELGLEV